jgi:hypothetical protein
MCGRSFIANKQIENVALALVPICYNFTVTKKKRGALFLRTCAPPLEEIFFAAFLKTKGPEEISSGPLSIVSSSSE